MNKLSRQLNAMVQPKGPYAIECLDQERAAVDNHRIHGPGVDVNFLCVGAEQVVTICSRYNSIWHAAIESTFRTPVQPTREQYLKAYEALKADRRWTKWNYGALSATIRTNKIKNCTVGTLRVNGKKHHERRYEAGTGPEMRAHLLMVIAHWIRSYQAN